MLCPDHASEKLPFEMETDEPDGLDEEEARADGKDKGGAKKRKATEGARYASLFCRPSSRNSTVLTWYLW